MNRNYNLKLDLKFRCNNSIMKFNQFDNNTSDFFIRITNGGKSFDVEKAIVVLATIKPSGKVASQFIEVKNDVIYADLKPNMKDEIGTYTAKAMLILEDKKVVTNVISYEVEEDKIFSLLNDSAEASEEFTLLTDMLSRLSTIEISEEQRMINEAERILSEENRKIEEANRVEAELIRQHEEADRAKYDATRESNENIRKINEEARISSENVRLENEANRIEQETNRVKAEQLRKDNYNFMTEDEDRRRSEANAHKEAEKLRVQAETNRVNEEAKRRTTEQARVSAENTRVSNYNSFILEAEANANNFENYTNSAKVKEEERKSNELNRKSQEDRRVSNEVERISNENTRKANEEAREKNETSRQNIFENKVNEVDEKIIEINTTKDNFVSSINTKVDNKISELDNAKSDMTNTVSNKVNEVETRFNALTTSQQQDAEVIDARVDFKGVAFDSLKERIDYTDKLLRDSTVSTVTTESDFTTVEATSNGYFEDVKLEGKTLANIVTTYDTSRFVFKDAIKQEDGYYKLQYGATVNDSYVIPRYGVHLYKPNTTYTIIVDIKENTTETFLGISAVNSPINSQSVTKKQFANLTGISTLLITTRDDITLTDKGITPTHDLYFGIWKDGGDLSKHITFRYWVLEGDHTQNPPSYFEGLKSVGQDVDEVSVESVNENLFDGIFYEGDINSSNGNDEVNVSRKRSGYIEVKPNKIISFDILPLRIVFYTENKKFISFTNGKENYIVPSNCKYIRFSVSTDVDTVMFAYSATPKLYTPHQSDKKRLLYYNNETQTWEKPTLRQWDSIEKHTNGKYYYHQRSGEVVLNGSESWGVSKTSENMLIVAKIPDTSIKGNDGVICNICDKFISVGANYQWLNEIESVAINSKGQILIQIPKSKLSTQNLQGFKQWLQTNNVTVVYKLAEEKVYECTNIDLITYANETNYVVNCGAIVPKSTLKVHNNISNVVNLLQKKVSLLESNIKASQEVQDMMILETDMRMLDIELALMDFMPMTLNLGGSDMLRSATYFNFLKNHIINETYEKEYLENVMNKYLATGRINQDEYDELYKMLYPPVYDIELPIEY